MQALCDASSGLTNFAHEDRQWALMRGLEDISAEIQAATRSGVAIWSPMGTGDDRIVRIAARECKLLNSRRAACCPDAAPWQSADRRSVQTVHEAAHSL